MRYKRRNREPIIMYFFCLFSIIALSFIVATSNKKNVFVASNINTVKAITSSHIKMKEREIEAKTNNYKEVLSIEDILNNQGNYIEFTGNIIEYSFNEKTTCDINIDNIINDIYYNDTKLGTIKIISSNSYIPCGSIVKISNYNNQEFIGIVIDHKEFEGMTIGLPLENEDLINNIEIKNNINFKIERWGF